MRTSFSQQGLHLLGAHLREIHVVVPNAPRRAGWRPNDKIRIRLADHLVTEFPVRRLVEIPSITIWFQRPHVESRQPLDVQAPSWTIGFFHDRTTTIEFHECRFIQLSRHCRAILLGNILIYASITE